MDLGLSGAHVCVQGGSAGMGRAAAEAFARAGALRTRGSPDVMAIPADIADRASVDQAFALISNCWPVLNLLVNTVSPDPVMSDALRGYVTRESGGTVNPDDLVAAGQWLKQRLGSTTDIGRVAHPDEIAPAILLASARTSTFMTGANINVDGGSHFQ